MGDGKYPLDDKGTVLGLPPIEMRAKDRGILAQENKCLNLCVRERNWGFDYQILVICIIGVYKKSG